MLEHFHKEKRTKNTSIFFFLDKTDQRYFEVPLHRIFLQLVQRNQKYTKTEAKETFKKVD